jgi:succinoglycan biosynthesis protein ExoM
MSGAATTSPPPIDWKSQRVKVAICTYRRPELLDRLLSALVELFDAAGPSALSVVVVDDSPEREGGPVVQSIVARTTMGIEYIGLGSQNIAQARNTALEAALAGSDWVVFLDDDCAPHLDWLDRMFDVQRGHDADIVTSGVRYVAPPSAPTWLKEDNFIEDFNPYGDGDVPDHGCMANVMLRSSWFLEHADVRFKRHLGETGGEDMLFLDNAAGAGAVMRWSSSGLVDEQLADERLNLRYMLYRSLWYGNNNVLVNLQAGWSSRSRLVLRCGKRFVMLIVTTLATVVRPSHFRWRKRLAELLHIVGMATGLVGVRLKHR